MFNSLFSNLVGWIASGLDFVLSWMLQLMTFNLGFFSDNFPVINELYGILQGVGISLVVAVASFQIFKYFTGPLSESTTNPLEILVRSGISFALIFWGNYILEFVVNLFSYPYYALVTVSGAEGTVTESSGLWSSAGAALGGLVSGGAGVLLALVLIIIVGWNVLKLVLEVVERFLMIGVLVYTSPLAWPSLASRATSNIFSKWISMFLSQCLLMLLNAWSVKMIISIIGYGAANTFFRFIVALAFCKVAQRFDTYLQTIGLNAAHTGGNLIDDVVAAGAALSGLTSKAAGAVATATGHKALGESLARNGIMGTAINRAAEKGYAASSIHSMNKDMNEYKPGTKGARTADGKGGFNQRDESGYMWNARTNAEMDTILAMADKGKPIYDGESAITQDKRGNFEWTDKDGNTHTAVSPAQMLAKQADVRNSDSYRTAAQNAHPIRRNQDGTFSFDTDTGTAYTSSSIEDAKITRSTVYPNPSPTDAIQTNNAARLSNALFNNNGTPKSGTVISTQYGDVLSDNIAGSTVQSRTSKLAELSSAAVMNTNSSAAQDNASIVKTNTLAALGVEGAQMLIGSGVDGGITDQRVAAKSAELLFGTGYSYEQANGIENGLSSVNPDLAESIYASSAEADSEGEVQDMCIKSGVITGTYVPPVDEDGSELMPQPFSILTQDAYNALSETQKSDYVPFTGADGQTYYTTRIMSQPEESNPEQQMLTGNNECGTFADKSGSGTETTTTDVSETTGSSAVVSEIDNIPQQTDVVNESAAEQTVSTVQQESQIEHPVTVTTDASADISTYSQQQDSVPDPVINPGQTSVESVPTIETGQGTVQVTSGTAELINDNMSESATERRPSDITENTVSDMVRSVTGPVEGARIVTNAPPDTKHGVAQQAGSILVNMPHSDHRSDTATLQNNISLSTRRGKRTRKRRKK